MAEVKDGDSRAYGLYRRHYSRRKHRDNRVHRKFVGPGEKLVLLSYDSRALFVWRKAHWKGGYEGVNCAVFRNESGHLSSMMIIAAEAYAMKRWSGHKLFHS